MQICIGVQQESPQSYCCLEQKNRCTQLNECWRHSHNQWHRQKAYGHRTGCDRKPFEWVEEAVLRMIGYAENKIPDETTKRKQQHPLRPFERFRINHAIHDKQETEACVCQGGGKWCRVSETTQGPFIKEVTLQVQDNTGKPHQDS